MPTTCPAHLTLLDLIVVSKELKLSVCAKFMQNPAGLKQLDQSLDCRSRQGSRFYFFVLFCVVLSFESRGLAMRLIILPTFIKYLQHSLLIQS
jgi:hypothetical protein